MDCPVLHSYYVLTNCIFRLKVVKYHHNTLIIFNKKILTGITLLNPVPLLNSGGTAHE